MPNAIYCGPPAGLPFAFILAKWKLPPNTVTCMAVLSPQMALIALLLDLIIWLIILIIISWGLNLLVRLRSH